MCTSFDLGRRLRIPIAPAVTDRFARFNTPSDNAFEVIGRLEVHYPCAGPVKVQLQAWLPGQQHSAIRLPEFIASVFEFLGIPPHEPFGWKFIATDLQTAPRLNSWHP
jgi:hypothetical protein